MDNGQLLMDNGQWTIENGQWTIILCHENYRVIYYLSSM